MTNRTNEFIKLLQTIDSHTEQPKSIVRDIQDEYTQEAYRIVCLPVCFGLTWKLGHIISLRNFLLGTRQAYMQIGPSRFQSRNPTQKGQQIGFLTDKERD